MGGWVNADEKRQEASLMSSLKKWWHKDPYGLGKYLETIAERDLGVDSSYCWIPKPSTELRSDWEQLLSIGQERKHKRAHSNRVQRHQTIEEKGEVKSRATGQKVIWEHFHDALLSASGAKYPSFYDMWRSPTHRSRLFRKLVKLDMTSFSFQSLIKTFSLCFYQPANFPPGAAADIIDHLWHNPGDNPQKRLKILDPCSGFGGRLLGFFASNRGGLYVGVDPNQCLFPAYQLMARQIASWDTRGLQKMYKMIRAGAEDVDYVNETGLPEKSFDMLLTSPPYFNTEIYSRDGGQSFAKFPTLAQWMRGFLFVMLVKAVRMIRPGGVILLNIKNAKGWNIDVTGEMTKFLQNYCGCHFQRTLHLNLHKRIGANHDTSTSNNEPIFLLLKSKHQPKLLPHLPPSIPTAPRPSARPSALARVDHPPVPGDRRRPLLVFLLRLSGARSGGSGKRGG